LAIHENRLLQARESGSDWPSPDLPLGEKTDRLDAANRKDVEPRQMICDNKARPLWQRGALRDHIQAEQGGERPAERDRQPQAQGPAPPQRDPLQGSDTKEQEHRKNECRGAKIDHDSPQVGIAIRPF
jgi:hypothetical protein